MMGMTTQRDNVSHQQLQRAASSKNAREPAKQLWLDAWADPVAGVKAFSCCIHTCNLSGDGDWRLVIADADKKLKVTSVLPSNQASTSFTTTHSGLDLSVPKAAQKLDAACSHTSALGPPFNVHRFGKVQPRHRNMLSWTSQLLSQASSQRQQHHASQH